MKSVLMEPADSLHPSNVFSPASQYAQAHSQLSKGAHHMVLKATQNDLYEREVACFIDGIKVGTLHEDEAYDYHRSINQLNAHGMELVVPCRVTDSNMIYYRPVPRESLRDWVADQLPKVVPEAAQTLTAVQEDAVPVALDQVRVSSRVNRHVLKLVSQDWFSPLDMGIMDRLAYGLYWHEEHTVDGTVGLHQSNALILITYALHRASSDSVIYDQTVTVCGEEHPVIVIDDLDLIDTIITAPQKADLMAKAVMSGSALIAV